MDDSAIEREIERTARGFRMLGWAFLIVGSLMFALALKDALDSTASMRINGVDTYDKSAKMGVVTFAAISPVIGAFLTFIPKRISTPFLRAQFQRVREIQRSLRMK